MKQLKICHILDETAKEVVSSQAYKLDDISEIALGACNARLELTLKDGQKICQDYFSKGIVYLTGV